MSKRISNIVFTRNRPLQLHAYLESLYKFFPSDLIQTCVLWKVELFTEQYKQLFTRFPACKIITETDFSKDFLNILNKIDTEYILFGVDDVVYFDSVDFNLIDKTFCENNDIFGFSLRFGRNVLENSNDKIHSLDINGQAVYKVNWPHAQTSNTRYPFELCATIYRVALVRQIISSSRNNNPVAEKLFLPNSALVKGLGKLISTRKILKRFGYFYSPNTLESWNCRWCQKNADKLPHSIYFQKQCASAIQVNIVNTSTANRTDGTEMTVEKLNELYKQGYSFDIQKLETVKPLNTHCGREKLFLTKK